MTLQSLSYTEPIFKWSPDEKLATAKELKDSGVDLFAQKRFYDAFLCFRQALTLVRLLPWIAKAMQGPML
jgi:hypothetical protein